MTLGSSPMSEKMVIQSKSWGLISSITRAIFLVVAATVIGYAFTQEGPPWHSWSSLAGYGIALAFPIVGFLFSENMLPRSVVVTPSGAEFQYLFSSRIVEWSRLSLSRNQPRNWEGLVNVEEHFPGRKVTRFHRVSPEQASAMKVWMGLAQ
jgi:hypothetical protein